MNESPASGEKPVKFSLDSQARTMSVTAGLDWLRSTTENSLIVGSAGLLFMSRLMEYGPKYITLPLAKAVSEAAAPGSLAALITDPVSGLLETAANFNQAAALPTFVLGGVMLGTWAIDKFLSLESRAIHQQP